MNKTIFKNGLVLLAGTVISLFANAQSWRPIGSASMSGHWNNITCNTTANGTWQSLGCFSCPSGWSLSGSSCVQIQAAETMPLVDGVCPPNFSLMSDSCVPNVTNAAAIYTCSKGTMSGGQCVIDPTPIAVKPLSFVCPKGVATYDGKNCTIGKAYGDGDSCEKEGDDERKKEGDDERKKGGCSTNINIPADPVYCQSPSKQSGSTCVWPKVSSTLKEYKCTDGHFLIGTSCLPPHTKSIPATAGPKQGF